MTYSLLADTGKKLRFARRFAQRRLVHVNLQVLYQCNCRCRICEFWKEPFKSMPQLSLEQVRLIAAKLRQLGPQIISIGGGEPFMHKGLLDICHALADDNFLVMISNGWFIDRARARALMQTGIYEVSVSIDYADPARHDEQRGIMGAHARAIEALRLLNEERVHPHQRINMISVVMDDNLDDIERLIQLSADLGISYLVTMYSHGRGTKPRLVNNREVSERLLALKRRYRHFVAMRGYLERFSQATADGDISPCRAGRNLWNIDCQGNVTLCIDKLDEPVGNILTDDIHAIERDLLAAQAHNECGACWTSCRGPIETLMYGKNRVSNLADYYQLTRDVPLGVSF